MPTDLMRDKEASDARYAAAKSITKKLAGLPDGDRLTVLRHVATEAGYALVPIGTNAPPTPAVAGKVG